MVEIKQSLYLNKGTGSPCGRDKIGYEYFDKVVSGNYSVQKIDKVNFPGKKKNL